uniref:Uncharacterized protein n=1 Tax=Cordyceps cicadae TaxID=218633 RepID=A0A481S138_9HYPO|nr:hypothetical protein [Cordyceps cicadae]QBG64887.1 hypothetical protein [Cordyceps cicadae]
MTESIPVQPESTPVQPESTPVQPVSSGSSSQINTNRRWLYTELNRMIFNNQLDDTTITPNLQGSIDTNGSITRRIVVNELLNHVNDNSNTEITQSNIPSVIAGSSFQAQNTIPSIIAGSSSQIQSNISSVITESGFSHPNTKPSWITDYSNIYNVRTAANWSVLFSDWGCCREIDLSEVTRIIRPKILAINFDFTHQNIEVIMQKFRDPQEFLVSHEHVPNLTRINCKQCVIDYYYVNANKTVYIYPSTILIENGDPRMIIRNV